MKETTIAAIETLAKADPEATPEIVRTIIRACKSPAPGRRQMVLAKNAMEMLGVSRPTLRKLVLAGSLHEFRATPRKTRFFLDEVEALMTTPREEVNA